MPRTASTSDAAYERGILDDMKKIAHLTTEAERAAMLQDWQNRGGQYLIMAAERKIAASTLLLLAMLDCNHPLIVDETGLLRFSLTGCLVEITRVAMQLEHGKKVVHRVCTMGTTATYPQALPAD